MRLIVELGIYPAVNPLSSSSRIQDAQYLGDLVVALAQILRGESFVLVEPHSGRAVSGRAPLQGRRRGATHPAALQGSSGHHRDSGDGRALRRRQAAGGAGAAGAALPVATVLRGLPVHRARRQVREARGHDRVVRTGRGGRVRPAAGASVLYAGRDRRCGRAGQETGVGLMRVTVISPERSLFDGEAESVIAPAFDGQVGILPRHAPFMTLLGDGVLAVRAKGGGGPGGFGGGGAFLRLVGDVLR